VTPEQIAALAQDIDFAIDVTEPREARLRRFEDAIRAALQSPGTPAEPSGPVETPPRLVAEPVGRTGIGVRIRQDAGLRDTALPQAEPRSLADQLHDDLLQSQAEPRADGPPADLVRLAQADAVIRKFLALLNERSLPGWWVSVALAAEEYEAAYPLPAEQAPR
jgi:hypothetical protein